MTKAGDFKVKDIGLAEWGRKAIQIAEHAMAMMLAFSRGTHFCSRRPKEEVWGGEGCWQRMQPHLLELGGATLGIVGFGGIGQATAQRAKCFGMRVIAQRRRLDKVAPVEVDELVGPERLDYLLKEYRDKLDELTEDNYYGRHNPRLINYLFPKIERALEASFLEIKKFSRGSKDKKLLQDWARKASKIRSFGRRAKGLSEKVLFIDSTTQFLRESSANDKGYSASRKKKSKNKTAVFKKEFKGIAAVKFASLKKTRGVVRIILGSGDFRKMKKDEILVTNETDATFLPVMKLAKAIITDEGGILCHAAIVARELKKPCIVGTKIATQILKTGDTVEVDARKGIIKIIKKYNI